MDRNIKINIVLAKISEACEYIKELKADEKNAVERITQLEADSERLDKILKICEIRHWYASHPDCYETVESRKAIDKLEEQDHESEAKQLAWWAGVIDKLKEEPDHECKHENPIPVEGRGWLCPACGKHLTGD